MPHKAVKRQGQKPEINKGYRKPAEYLRHLAKLKALYAASAKPRLMPRP